jgi:hypothetical protein
MMGILAWICVLLLPSIVVGAITSVMTNAHGWKFVIAVWGIMIVVFGIIMAFVWGISFIRNCHI